MSQLNAILSLSNRQICWLAFFISLGISLILFLNLDLWNRDGFLYLETAHIFNQNGFKAAFKHFHWPFLSILTTYIATAFFLTIEQAFYIQSCLFFGLIAYGYSHLSFILFSTKSKAIIAIIVFFCAAMVNDYRDLIVRDHGAWAFTILSITCLVRGIKTKQIKYLGFSLALIALSTLFRPECAFNFLLFPLFYVFASTSQENINYYNKQLIKYAPVLIILTIFVISLFYMYFNNILIHLNYMAVLFKKISTLYPSNFLDFKENIIAIMPEFSQRYTTVFIAFGLLGVVFAKILHIIGYLYSLLCLIFLKDFIKWFQDNRFFCYFYLALIIPNLIFIFLLQYLDNRYCFCFCLLLLFPLSEAISQTLLTKKSTWLKYITFILIILSLIDSFYSTKPTYNTYYKDSVLWIKQNLPQEHNILTNNSRLNFLIHGIYKQHSPIDPTDLNINNSNFIIIQIGHKQLYKEKLIINQGWIPLQTFSNNKKDCIIIFSKSRLAQNFTIHPHMTKNDTEPVLKFYIRT